MSSKGFNVDLGNQFVPFWNGLIHLVGKVENGTVIRRTDWKNVIQECKEFEKNYLNSNGFCESCTFFGMPDFLEKKMEEAKAFGLSDCKQIAKDNDYLYLYCVETTQPKKNKSPSKKGGLWWKIILSLFFIFIGIFLFVKIRQQ